LADVTYPEGQKEHDESRRHCVESNLDPPGRRQREVGDPQTPEFGQVPAVMSHPPLASGATATVPGATLFPEQSSNQ
jgi:hypothetical protein